jgi:hypothetical protein
MEGVCATVAVGEYYFLIYLTRMRYSKPMTEMPKKRSQLSAEDNREAQRRFRARLASRMDEVKTALEGVQLELRLLRQEQQSVREELRS